MKDTLRFTLPAIGAFLLGVFPGMNWLERFAATSPVMPGAGEQIFLILILASSGSLAGVAVFRLIYRTKPIGTDAAITVTYALVFGFIGFMYLLTLVV
jgi:hypothetical protein